MNRGYVRFWRKALDNGLIANAEAWRLFTYLLLKATHKPHQQLVGTTVVDLKPGQVIVGRKALAADLHSTERRVRTAISTIKSMGIVTSKATNQFTVITICNWELYQSNCDDSDQPDDQQTTSQPTNGRPAGDQRPTTNKNIKNKEHREAAAEAAATDDTSDALFVRLTESIHFRNYGYEAWVRTCQRYPKADRAAVVDDLLYKAEISTSGVRDPGNMVDRFMSRSEVMQLEAAGVSNDKDPEWLVRKKRANTPGFDSEGNPYD